MVVTDVEVFKALEVGIGREIGQSIGENDLRDETEQQNWTNRTGYWKPAILASEAGHRSSMTIDYRAYKNYVSRPGK